MGDQQFNRGTITQVSSLRYQEIIDFVRKDVLRHFEQIFPGHSVKLDQAFLPSGVVLTGGTANLQDAADGAQLVFGVTSRVGIPSFETDALRKPEYSGVIGMMVAAIQDAPPVLRRPKSLWDNVKELFRL